MAHYQYEQQQQKQILRKKLRAKRRALSRQEQEVAAVNINRMFARTGLLRRYHSVALYLANDGEIDPYPLLNRLLKQHVECYLPVINPFDQLWFARYRSGDKLYKNRFNILEPHQRYRRHKIWSINAILLPLVGFDRKGGRLGMGGGFYDKTLSAMKLHSTTQWPKLIGLAHSCQEVDQVITNSWDIPLSQIVTDKDIIDVT